jgi:hypothetical protein
MEHVLNVDPKFKLVRQHLRTMSEKGKKAAGVIREVQFSNWPANVVMVPKKNGKWRMSIYFTNLNKACPKDDCPLPQIDTLVDEAAGSNDEHA